MKQTIGRNNVGSRNRISSTQLFTLLLLSRGVLSVACGAFSGSGNIGCAALSAVIALIASIIISIPVLYLGRCGAQTLKNGTGRAICGIYALYFFLCRMHNDDNVHSFAVGKLGLQSFDYSLTDIYVCGCFVRFV